MRLIRQYFPNLSEQQLTQLEQLKPLYEEWNAKINVISRKDIGNLYLHHVLHSLSIAKVLSFHPEAKVLDFGTGGGFPGIPLAILFPEANFHLVDSTRKKITVVEAVADALQLKNVKAEWIRGEDLNGQYDFVVSRAVKDLPTLLNWSKNKVKPKSQHKLKNGMLVLKGGDIEAELQNLPVPPRIFEISEFFGESYFERKYVVYVPVVEKI